MDAHCLGTSLTQFFNSLLITEVIYDDNKNSKQVEVSEIINGLIQ